MPTITLIGLGPGDPALLTRAAAEALARAPLIVTPTPDHPALADLPSSRCRPLPLPDPAARLREQAAMAPVVCALPGHPLDHPLAAELRDASVQLVPGVSLVDACCAALGLAGRGAGLHVLPATALRGGDLPPADPLTAPAWSDVQGIGPYTPPITPYPLAPTRPALLWNDDDDGHGLQAALLLRYPPDHQLRLVRLAPNGQSERVWTTALAGLADDPGLAAATAIAIPPLAPIANRRSLEGLSWIVARLLGPGGCPWDREQTAQSLRGALLEETHEALEALDAGDMAGLAEELGDVLLQIVVQSEMARQAGHFALDEVISQISAKLIRRHPHVFAELSIEDNAALVRTWEQIKAQELAAKGRTRAGLLDGVPAGLPALAAAQKLVQRAGRTGFEWPAISAVWEKLHEELAELAEAQTHGNRAQQAEEFGDVLFVLANLGRWLDIDAESALREANAKFRRRFTYLEQAAQRQGRHLAALSLEEMLDLWQAAKRDA